MDYPDPRSALLHPSYLQQPVLASDSHAYPAMEGHPPHHNTQRLPFSAFDQGELYLSDPAMHAYGETAMFPRGGFTEGEMSLSLAPAPAATLVQPSALPQIPDGDNDVNVQPMAPPSKSRKRKAPTLRVDKWEPVKPRVIELHITQNIPLNRVRKMVEEEFSFTATNRQYRTRLSEWGLDKKVKQNEMKAIVRKRQQRRLIETDKGELSFTVRGRVVEPEKIDRWMKSHGVTESIPYFPSPTASTPAALSAWTASERGSPAPSPAASLGSPNSAAISQFQSLGHSLGSHSPAPSLSSTILSGTNAFTGQSPAPSYRSISGPETLINQADSSQQHLPWSQPHPPANDRSAAVIEYRYRRADEDRLRHELSLREAQLGEEHPETLSVLQELGDVLLAQGRYRSAEEMSKRLVTGVQQQYSNDHSRTLQAREQLVRVWAWQGFYDKAEKLHLRTLEARKKEHEGEHPDTLNSMGILAWTYRQQGRWKEAEELEVQVLEASKRVLGAEHLGTLNGISDLASTYWNQGRWKEAEELEVQVLEISKRVLGAEHPDTLSGMSNLASTYWNQGRWKEAEELEVQVWKARKRVLGAEHPDTLNSMAGLALTCEEQGRYLDALSLMKECVQRRNPILGAAHPDTLSSSATLTKWQMDI